MHRGRSNAGAGGGRRVRSGASTPPAVATPAGVEARDRAFRLLAGRARSFPEMTGDQLDETGLSARDAALAYAIAQCATRYWLTLTYLLELHLKTPLASLEPPMRAVLLGGAAQIVLMDRVPVHAAIDTSVQWAKRAIRPGAAGMVNAVLRRVAELAGSSASQPRPRRDVWAGGRDEIPLGDGSALVLAHPALPKPAPQRIATATSHPLWLVSRWISRLGMEGARELAHHSLVNAPVILNISHARAGLEPSEYLSPHASPGHVVASGPRDWLATLLGSRKDVWAQDPASARAVAEIAENSGQGPRTVLDLCAGQGTKTRQLAAVFPTARVVACDPDPVRSQVLREAFAESRQVTVLTPGEVRADWSGKADLILLDVPCSNTGVLARRLEAKYRCGPAQLSRLTSLQREILESSFPLLAPGGKILYSTCSLDDEENHAIAAGVPGSGLALERETLTLPVGRPGGDPRQYHDGSYSALLSRCVPT